MEWACRHSDKFVQRAGGMADGVEGSHLASRRLAPAIISRATLWSSAGNDFVLLRKYRSQIEQHASFFNPRDDRRIIGSQASGESRLRSGRSKLLPAIA